MYTYFEYSVFNIHVCVIWFIDMRVIQWFHILDQKLNILFLEMCKSEQEQAWKVKI